MKTKILILSILTLLTCTFTACNKDGGFGNYPILYVVNASDYSVKVYCDNLLVTSVNAHNNSGKVVLSNTSVNLPVYVEANYYNAKGQKAMHNSWNVYFRWNKSYKMTLNNSVGSIEEL